MLAMLLMHGEHVDAYAELLLAGHSLAEDTPLVTDVTQTKTSHTSSEQKKQHSFESYQKQLLDLIAQHLSASSPDKTTQTIMLQSLGPLHSLFIDPLRLRERSVVQIKAQTLLRHRHVEFRLFEEWAKLLRSPLGLNNDEQRQNGFLQLVQSLAMHRVVVPQIGQQEQYTRQVQVLRGLMQDVLQTNGML
jgi:hypothetical protein